jgi:hypothetical protein
MPLLAYAFHGVRESYKVFCQVTILAIRHAKIRRLSPRCNSPICGINKIASTICNVVNCPPYPAMPAYQWLTVHHHDGDFSHAFALSGAAVNLRH